MKKNQGFTVIELLVVLALMGIVLTMTITIGRSAMQKSSFNGAVNKFVSDFSYAKQLALRENRYVMLDFDPNGKLYTIKKQATIGDTDTDNWDIVKQEEPMSDKDFFDGSSSQDFAVNSVGEVFTCPLAANPQPTQISLSFFVKNRVNGTVDYQKNVIIYAYGGIKIAK